MRNPDRISRLSYLFERIWRDYPDLRFGQLYMNLMHKYCAERGWKPEDNRFQNVVWLMEDADFEKFLENFKGF